MALGRGVSVSTGVGGIAAVAVSVEVGSLVEVGSFVEVACGVFVAGLAVGGACVGVNVGFCWVAVILAVIAVLVGV